MQRLPLARWRMLALALALVLFTAACGSDSSDDETAADTTTTAAESTDDAGDEPVATDAFPVTVEHQYGSVEIPEAPQRVVSIGYQEHDVVYALGVAPIAVRYWFGDEADVIYPWAEDAVAVAVAATDPAQPETEDPEILNMAFGQMNFEAIAALQPDLIVGVYSGMTPEEYETLSEIAPTIAQPDGFIPFGVPWQDATRLVGQALGRTEIAETAIADLEAQFAAVAEANPEWAGQQVVVSAYRADQLGAFASEDPRTRFFTLLGFDVNPAIDEAAGERFVAELSAEQADLLDGDLIVWDQMTYVPGGRATIAADPIIGALTAMKNGQAIYMEGITEAAFAFNSVLSLPYVLDAIVPAIEAAVDGDPATTVPAEQDSTVPVP